jgi:hypothetical protein
MKKQMTKIIATLFAILIVTSLTTFFTPIVNQATAQDNIPPPTPATGTNTSPPNTDQPTADQEKAMYFMENLIPIDLSKYTIQLKNEWTTDKIPSLSKTAPEIDRKITRLIYQLNSEERKLTINFIIEKGKIVSCNIDPIEGQIITSKQYLGLKDAVSDFLEKYQPYTQIDSNHLITMLNNVDITKNSTTVIDNIRLGTYTSYFSEEYHRVFDWTHTIDGVDYTWLVLIFDAKNNLVSITDTRTLYTIGDISINISMEQAIDIALENLTFYSYKMPDGSVVNDFKVGDVAAMLYTMPMDYVDYVLRPYWDVKLFLEEGAPGNVFGITVFMWANTGEIISYSNMAHGGINYDDNYDPSDNNATPQNQNMLLIGIAIVAVIAVVTTGILITKKKQK